jgi:3,4-dihydroxy 2-butanone 4-phosphate synthase/GTP cyclohydrolase II
VRRALACLRAGTMIVLSDGEDRENMGMLMVAAQFVTVARLQDLTRLARGTTYLALTDERCEELGLELVPSRDASLIYAPVTATIAAREGIDTGISLAERAHTISVAIDPAYGRRDIRLGGHIQPLRARPFGVVERPGLTEAAVDLAKLGGLTRAAVFGEIQLEDGSTAQGEALVSFAGAHDFPIVSVADVAAFRLRNERLVERIVDTRLPTSVGEFSAIGYRSMTDNRANLALVKGQPHGTEGVLSYIHRACWAGDVFGSRLCNCRANLDAALAAAARASVAVIVHLAHPEPDRHLTGRRDSLSEDWLGGQILAELGVASVTLLIGPGERAPDLDGHGFTVRAYRELDVAVST